MNFILILLILTTITIITIVIINKKSSSEINNTTSNTTMSLLTKNDIERTIIIKNINKGYITELRINTEYLSQVFDNLITTIQEFVKNIINQNDKKLSKEEINNLLPNFIASFVENLLKITLINLFEQQQATDLNVLKTKLLSILQNNYISYFLLKDADIKNTTEIINNSTQYLNSMGINSKNDSIEKIPKLFSKIIFDMSKGIISNVIIFDEKANMIKLDNLNNIKTQFINVLNKYLPYKKIYFETSNNGSNNLPGVTLKLDQLNVNENENENEKTQTIITKT